MKQHFTANVLCQVPDYYPVFVSEDVADVSDGFLYQCQQDFFIYLCTIRIV